MTSSFIIAAETPSDLVALGQLYKQEKALQHHFNNYPRENRRQQAKAPLAFKSEEALAFDTGSY